MALFTYPKAFISSLMLSLSISIYATSFTYDGLTYNILSEDDKTCEVTTSEVDGTITIPSEAMSNNVRYRVVSIGAWAFDNCVNLTSVKIPSSVKSIGFSAFWGCSGLKNINIPNTVETIQNAAFYKCSGLTKVAIPNSITELADNIFTGCSGLTTVELPNSITSIGNYAFMDCSGLTSINIPESVLSIGEYAFSNCSILPEINIPESVTTIERCAFKDCSALKRIVWETDMLDYIRSKLTYIGEEAFAGCVSMKEFRFPRFIEIVGDGAFRRCVSLESISVISFNLKSVGKRAFYECIGLKSASIYYISVLEEETFAGCLNLENVYFSVGDFTIKKRAFYACPRLKYIDLPSKLDYIGEEAFSLCNSLTKINCDNPIPPKIFKNTWDDHTYSTAVLQVKTSAEEAYKNAEGWGNFKYINREPTNAVADVYEDTDTPSTITVYNMQGIRQMVSSRDELSNLTPGIYIQNGKKIIIK